MLPRCLRLRPLATVQAEVSGAHEGGLSTMAWHPLGHMLATGSNDLTIRFWTSSKASGGRQRQQARSNAAVPEGEFLRLRRQACTRTTDALLNHSLAPGRGSWKSAACDHGAHEGHSWHQLDVA